MSEKIVQLNEEVIKGRLKELVRGSIEETLKVPKLKGISFETAIIERYRRRESSVEEALIEMYLAVYPSGVSRTSQRPCGAAKSLLPPSAN